MTYSLIKLPYRQVQQRAFMLATKSPKDIGTTVGDTIDAQIEQRFMYLIVQLASCKTTARRQEAGSALAEAINAQADADGLLDFSEPM